VIKKFQHQNGWQDLILIWRSKKSAGQAWKRAWKDLEGYWKTE